MRVLGFGRYYAAAVGRLPFRMLAGKKQTEKTKSMHVCVLYMFTCMHMTVILHVRIVSEMGIHIACTSRTYCTIRELW